MAGSKSDAFENEVLRLATGQASTFTGLGTNTLVPYLALFTGTLAGDTPGTECVGGGYARISSAGKWAGPSAGSVTNNAAVVFAASSGAWSSGAAITHFGLFDALSGGNAMYYGDLSDITKAVTGVGDTMSFAIGALTLTES